MSMMTRLYKASPPADIQAIPHELRLISRWIVWDYGDYGEKGKKPRKVPILAGRDVGADYTDPAVWRPFEDVIEEARRRKGLGIGFVFTDDDDVVGVDLDDAIAGGNLKPWAKEIFDRFATWAEKSPSGSGVHFVGRADRVVGKTRAKFSDTEAVERYSQARWFTLSGDVMKAVPVADVREAMAWLDEQHFRNRPVDNPQPAAVKKANSSYDPDPELDRELARVCLRHLKAARAYDGDDWRRVGMACKATADDLFDEWLAFSRRWPECDEEECRDRWRRFAPASVSIGSLVHMAAEDSGLSAVDLIREAKARLGRDLVAGQDGKKTPDEIDIEERVAASRQGAAPSAAPEAAHGLVRAAEADPVMVPALAMDTGVPGLTAGFTGSTGSMMARVQVATPAGLLLDVQDVRLSDQRKRHEFALHAGRLLQIDAVAVESALVRLAAVRCHPPVVASGAVPFTTCIQEWLERDEPEALPTGLQAFDLATGGGLPLGAVTLFSAPPGVGKTAMALQLALGAMALDPSLRVVYGLGEMTRRAFARRVAVVGASVLGLEPVTLRQAKERNHAAYKASLAVEKAFGDRLTIVDGIVSAERVGLAVAETGAKIAILDYLQRLHSPIGGDDRVRELEMIAEKVLELAVSRDMACILLAATAKSLAADARVDQIVRGSGSPGFDAELAYLGDAPPPEERGADYPVVWRCLKARSEGLIHLRLLFDGPTQTFHEERVATHKEFDAFAATEGALS